VASFYRRLLTLPDTDGRRSMAVDFILVLTCVIRGRFNRFEFSSYLGVLGALAFASSRNEP